MVNISKRRMKELSAQERTVLFLDEAFNELLHHLQSGYVYSKVDVAFASENGLAVYSYSNGTEVSQFLVDPDGAKRFIDSPGAENPEDGELPVDANKENIHKIFRKWEADESEESPRTMLSKVEYLGYFDDQTKAYCVAIGYRDSVLNKEVIQYFFSELVNSLRTRINRRDMEELTEIRPKIDASGISREVAVKILADRFYDNFRDDRGAELYEILCMLSCASYEKSQNRGRIGIFTPALGKNKSFVRFADPIVIRKTNVRIIRKLLELSDRTNTILIAREGMIIGVYAISDPGGKYSGTGILFRGYGRWELFSGKVGAIIVFDSVMVKLANQSIDLRIREGFRTAKIRTYNETAILDMVNCARRQSHGTTIIVSEAAVSESERLAEADRAIRIEPIPVDEKTFLALSAIDGAILIDTSGVCYAIGAILDGVIGKTGNIARGARYNSAITYVDYEAELKNKSVAIIVSADDTVDIYPDQSFFREPLSKGKEPQAKKPAKKQNNRNKLR